MNEPIIIIGDGAVGVGLAAILLKSGFTPRLLGRRGSVKREVTMQFAANAPESLSLPALEASELSKATLVFVAVKAYDVEGALSQHLPFFRPDTVVISIGNGAIDGVLAHVAETFPKLSFRLGTSTLPVSRNEETYKIPGSEFKISWGPFLPKESLATDQEKALLSSADSPFAWLDDPAPAFRKKWLFNTTLNSIVGMKRMKTNGGALKNPKMLMMVFSEAYSLGEEHWGPWPSPPQDLFAALLQLIEKTSQNENSMAADVRLGRRTETDFLAGLANEYEDYPILKQIDERLQKPE